MTQALSNLPPASAAPRAATGNSSDSPDILFILRHYRWLLILGTLLGLLVSAGLWFFFRTKMPEYSVEAQFQVLPAVVPDSLENGVRRGEASREDIERTIRRQVLLVLSSPVLDDVLRTQAFEDSNWKKEHRQLSKIALRKALDISPVGTNTDIFRIAMRGRDPVELGELVKAIATTYTDTLKNNDKLEYGQGLDSVRAAQENLRKSVESINAGLEEFRRTHDDITTMTQAYQAKTNLLMALTTEMVKAESNVVAAKANAEMVKKQVEAGTLQLSAEQEFYVSNDGAVRNLENTCFYLQQDLAANVLRYSEGHPSSQAIQARINEIQKQLEDTREKLRQQARLRMQESAESATKSAIALYEDMKSRLEAQERIVKDLDQALFEYRSKSAELESKQKLLDEYSRQLTIRGLINPNDVSRIRSFGSVYVPDRSEVAWPLAKTFLPAGLGIGLLLSFALAYLMELTNTRVRTPRDITRTMQLPLLGFVPDQDDDSFVNGDLATSIRTSPASLTAESFRQIRGRLVAQANGKPLTSLLVASASPGGGATTVASNLANGIALNGLRVLLIDANFFRPGLKNAYKNLPAAGLGDILAGRTGLDEAVVVHPELPTLHLLGAGTLPATSASELLESKAFKEFLAQVRTRFDMVIFDGAPLNLVSDSLTLAAKLDGTIAVVRAGVISRGTVGRVRDQLKQVHANLLGIVLNAAQTRGSGYFKQNYRSFYEYAGPVAHHAHPQVTAPASHN